MQEQIREWTDQDGPYETGLALLRQTGYSGFVLTVLARGDDAYTRQKLTQALTAWLDAKPKNVLNEQLISSKPAADQPPIGPGRPKENLVAGVTVMTDRRSQLLDERAELKAKIRAVLDDADREDDRRDWAFRIKAVTRELDEVFSQLGFYQENGYLPPVADDPALVLDDRTLLLNVRTYVSRYRKKVKAAKSDAERDAANVLLWQYEAEKNRLENKLRDAV